MKFFGMLSLVMIALLVAPFQANAQDVAIISPVRAKLMANQGALLLDLRTPEEVAAKAYDVTKQINIPLADLESRLAELPKDQPIILACRTGNKSSQAANILTNKGFTNLSNLEGGIEAWEARNLSVVEGGTKAKKACCASGEASAAAKGCGGSEKTAAQACGSKAEASSSGAAKACCAGDKAATQSCGSKAQATNSAETGGAAKASCAGDKAATQSCGSKAQANNSTGTGGAAKACCAGKSNGTRR